MAKSVDKRLSDVVGKDETSIPDAKKELQARIDGVTAGVGDVLESMAADVRSRMDALGAQMGEIQQGMEAIVERVGALAPPATGSSKS